MIEHFPEPLETFTLIIAPFTRLYPTDVLIDLFRTCGPLTGFYKPCGKEFVFVQFGNAESAFKFKMAFHENIDLGSSGVLGQPRFEVLHQNQLRWRADR